MRSALIILILNISYSVLCAQLPCYNLIWQDEFTGSALDTSKWRYQNGGWSGSSNVQNCYTPQNTTVSNGKLNIEAKYEPGYQCFNSVKDFTSGFVQTKDKIDWTFGYFEARVKVPVSNSTWPAFWMSPQDDIYGPWPQSGEIDIFEIKGHDLTKAYVNAHWGNSAADKQQQKGTHTFATNDDASNWHIYAVEWKLGELHFYIDNQYVHTIDNFDEPNATVHPGPFDIGYYLRLNVAVGGNYLGSPWSDANNGINQLPAVMEVDWVRVYEIDNNCSSCLALENTTCDDLDDCTINEKYDANCNCLIGEYIDADLDGICAFYDQDDTNPCIPNLCDDSGCNLVLNGDFSNGLTDWTLFEFANAAGNLSISPNGYCKIEIANASTSSWHLALRQSQIELIQGSTYEISFDAYADANRSCPIILSKSDGSQYAYISQSLSTSPNSYTHAFTMNSATDLSAFLNFNVGNDSPSVYIDNVKIKEVTCISEQNCIPFINDFSGQLISDGTYQVSDYINSRNKIKANVNFEAANAIELISDFETDNSYSFSATIDNCD